jgi:hypothetical protein
MSALLPPRTGFLRDAVAADQPDRADQRQSISYTTSWRDPAFLSR